ncbi:MAG: hypothetical protein ACKVP3_22430 [Hyphomicrobiaceae bacterium]
MCRKALIGARLKAPLKIAAVVAIATFAPHVSASAASPFDRLAGSWTGGGRVTFEGGQSERLRCNARYASSGSGNRLDLTIRCASPATSFELRGDLAYRGGRVSGNWQERTLGASGRAAGRANAGSIVMRISGSASGSMSVALSGGAQTVTVSTVDTALRGINVSLRRR